MSEYGNKGCTSVYKCCGRNNNGCCIKKDDSKAIYPCCGISVNSFKNNYISGCQSKWTCCNKSYYDNNGYVSIGCNYRQKVSNNNTIC